MSRQLEETIEQLRELSEVEQDAAVTLLFEYLSSDARLGNSHTIDV